MTTLAIQPSQEGDFALPANFQLSAGGVLHNASLRFALYGRLNSARSNVVLVCHALSGSARVADWWPAIFRQSRTSGIIDLETQAVLGINILGSCYGSTGPSSTDPGTGQPYGLSFPLVQIADIVRAQALLLDSQGIERVTLAIGASLGGMQVIEWALQCSARIERAVVIGAAPLCAMGLALNHLQRQAIQLDPLWNGGNYPRSSPPKKGLALARALAVCSYKSAQLFEERFARKPDRSREDPFLDSPHIGRFDVGGYLDHQGVKFHARFDANSYLSLTRAMDLFDPDRSHAASGLWSRIQAEVTLVGISSDWLFPTSTILSMHQAMVNAGVRCAYRELVSSHGHDAFLAEPHALFALLQS